MSTYVVTNPATGQSGTPFVSATDAQVSEAIAAAHAAHQNWSRKTTIAERAALIENVAELHRIKREQLAEIIVREMGKPLAQALGEVDFSPQTSTLSTPPTRSAFWPTNQSWNSLARDRRSFAAHRWVCS
jgi:acyl-CoA reductase-like NAD-dependent aldehyde dehydrogenase